MIFTKKLSHDYLKKDDEGNVIGKVRALDDVNVHVKPGPENRRLQSTSMHFFIRPRERSQSTEWIRPMTMICGKSVRKRG